MKILPESELMLETPAQPTPKRSVTVTEDEHKKMTEDFVLNLTVKRSSDFSTLAGEELSSDLVSGSIEHHDLSMERNTISKEDYVNADICTNEVMNLNMKNLWFKKIRIS